MQIEWETKVQMMDGWMDGWMDGRKRGYIVRPSVRLELFLPTAATFYFY